MKTKILKTVLFGLMLMIQLPAKSQITNNDLCSIYTLTSKEVKKSISKFDSSFIISLRINLYNETYFPEILKVIMRGESFLRLLDSLNNKEFSSLGIRVEKFKEVTKNREIKLCKIDHVKKIKFTKYLKQKKYRSKCIALCTFSNIGYYDNFAVVEVMVILSYGRKYVNFYFFKKEKDWNFVYAITELE